MANTANTDWKLTDLWNTSLFTFDSSNGWHPTNENQTVELTGEEYNIPWDNITQKIDYGLGKRLISLQGVDIADKDVWSLSSALSKRQIMKLWTGEDFFYYVLGVEPRQVRDVTLPYQKTYNVSFIGVDPHYYFSNSAAGSGSGLSWVSPGVEREASGVIDVVLSGSGANEGTTFVEPCFWVVGGASTSVTKITIVDDLGASLVYSPTTTIGSGHEHVIMPYRNTVRDGFMVNDATGFELTAAGKTATVAPSGVHTSEVTGDWPFDAFQHGAGTDVSATAASNTYKWITNEKPCIVSRNGTDFIDRNRYYPMCLDGVTTTLAVTYTGTSTDVALYALWCERRV